MFMSNLFLSTGTEKTRNIYIVSNPGTATTRGIPRRLDNIPFKDYVNSMYHHDVVHDEILHTPFVKYSRLLNL